MYLYSRKIYNVHLQTEIYSVKSKISIHLYKIIDFQNGFRNRTNNNI